METQNTQREMRPIKAVPIDYVPPKPIRSDMKLLIQLDQDEEKDRFNLFHEYDEQRQRQLYDMT